MISQADIELARVALAATGDAACTRVAAALDGMLLRPPTDEMPAPRLVSACRALGIKPSWDGYVSEAQAARLLNRRVKTLRNRRHGAGDLPYRKGPGTHGRVEYRLADLETFAAKAE